MPRILRQHLTELHDQKRFQSIVLGWPDAESEASRELQKEIVRVATALRELWPIQIVFWGEAFSSVEAKRRLEFAPKRIREQKGKVDQLAAQILLQEFLDAGCPFTAHAEPPNTDPNANANPNTRANPRTNASTNASTTTTTNLNPRLDSEDQTQNEDGSLTA